MKRIVAFMAVLCLLLSCFSFASAAVSITQQPKTQTVKAGGSLTFKVKAKGVGDSSITWYFTNPATGEVVTGRKLKEAVGGGLKVQNPNSLNITLKKIPESMHGWTLHCHIGRKGAGVDTDEVMILIAGKPAPTVTPKPSTSESSSGSAKEKNSGNDEKGSKDEDSGDSGESELPTVTATPEPPKPIVITGNKKIELYRMDKNGAITGSAAEELTFQPGETANFYVKLPEGTEGTIKYVTVGGIRLTPDGEVKGMSIRGWDSSATVRVKIDTGEEEEPEATRRPVTTPEPVDESQLVTVTCENCRFTGYTNSYAETGKVPVGTTITVVASGGLISKGYTINKAKKQYKNKASFQIVIEEDTTISLEKQK